MKKMIILQIVGIVILTVETITLFFRVFAGRGDLIRDGILMLVGVAFFAVATCLAVKERRIREFLIARTESLTREKAEKDKNSLGRYVELSTLQSQINPHFLYNTLDSIRSEALVNRQYDIAKMTEHLSRFFRYCISGAERIVKLSEEIRHIEDYFYIQKYRFGDKLEMEIHLEEESLREYHVPKITLQPIVENAVVHGLEAVRRNGKLDIDITATESALYIRVSDNGCGMSEEKLIALNDKLRRPAVKTDNRTGRHGMGIALQNVNSRIKICFGEQYGLHYRSMEGEGTEAEIVLPLISDYNREVFEQRMDKIR